MKCLIFLSFLLTAGCSIAAKSNKISSKTYPAKDKNCDIDIFVAKAPKKKFEELAFIKNAYTINSLKEKACLIGADGILYKSLGSIVAHIAIKYKE